MKRWDRVEQLFHGARALKDEARATYLNKACGDDAELRVEVESLLKRETESGLPFDRPLVNLSSNSGFTTIPSPITPGSRLGPYEIVSQAGAGGMGVVYKARDTRLNRLVAIKVLPNNLVDSAALRQRLKREAEAIAALNHAHICTLHDLGNHDGIDFLVMEYVEGPTLFQRMARQSLTVKEALDIALQIAEALEAAHDKGIVHRDLKPANVKTTDTGAIKVLDFGIAKMLDAGDRVGESGSVEGTDTGTILGTVAYMSPEQARGQLVDRRTDIWAFGCVLYEMLAGKKSFAGETVSDTLATVLTGQPDWEALPEEVPSAIRILLRRCLEKERQRRLPNAGAARIEIEEALTGSIDLDKRPVANSRWPWIVAAMMTAGFTILAAIHFRETAPQTPAEMRLEITTPARALDFDLSPDGKTIVFVSSEGSHRLWLRRLDQTAPAQPLPGTENAQWPRWSPNSKSIAFLSLRQLKRVDTAGGGPVVLADTTGGRGGGSWNSDGTIIFAGDADIYSVRSSAGGPLVKLLHIQDAGTWSPQFLPDGKHFLFNAIGGVDIAGIYLASLDSSTPKRLSPTGRAAKWLPPDRVAFLDQGKLWARRLDLNRAEWMGDADPVADAVQHFSTASDGIIAYSGPQSESSRLIWLDRTGKTAGKLMDPDSNVISPEISPDGKVVAIDLTVPGSRDDVWLIDLVRGGLKRLTFDSAADGYPVWFPDGNRIAFESDRKGDFDIYVKPVNSEKPEESILELLGHQWPEDISKDGKFLLYYDGTNLGDLWAFPLTGDNKQRLAVAATAFSEGYGEFSPDSRWVAYETNESGRFEIVVQAFPKAFDKYHVSTGGGRFARWSPNRNELYFIADDKLMVSTFHASGSSFEASTPTPLFPVRMVIESGGGGNHPQYAVSKDGRFLVNQPAAETSSTPITLILNWRPKAQ